MIEQVSEHVIIIGTAHVSAKSVADVETTIREKRPDIVMIELDERRFDALRDPDRWQNTDIVQILREKKQHMFLLQLYLANMQARVGKETGVKPGSEMLRAIEVADEIGAQVKLIDRDVSITLKRGFGAMGFWQRLKLFWNVWAEILTPSQKDEALDVDAMLETDAITAMTEEFARFAPVVKTALIDERDAYMASHIHAARGSVVAVVGAGHMPGIKAHLANQAQGIDRDQLDELPPKKLTVGKVLAYVIPMAIIGAFVYAGYTGGVDNFLANLKIWIILNGSFAALGALIAFGHPLSILVAFLAAPITSLNPLLAAGWFAGLTEAKVRTPTVADFEAIQHIEGIRGFWTNPVVRVLLVTALANVGSSIATYLAGYQIVQNLIGT